MFSYLGVCASEIGPSIGMLAVQSGLLFSQCPGFWTPNYSWWSSLCACVWVCECEWMISWFVAFHGFKLSQMTQFELLITAVDYCLNWGYRLKLHQSFLQPELLGVVRMVRCWDGVGIQRIFFYTKQLIERWSPVIIEITTLKCIHQSSSSYPQALLYLWVICKEVGTCESSLRSRNHMCCMSMI